MLNVFRTNKFYITDAQKFSSALSVKIERRIIEFGGAFNSDTYGAFICRGNRKFKIQNTNF